MTVRHSHARRTGEGGTARARRARAPTRGGASLGTRREGGVQKPHPVPPRGAPEPPRTFPPPRRIAIVNRPLPRFFFSQEVDESDDGAESITLALGDSRSEHVRGVLKLAAGDSLRVGVVNGSPATAVVSTMDATSMTLTWRPGVETPDGDTARRSLTAPLVDVDLLLAMPRPKVMTRLWAPLASIGVRNVYLTNASRVERYYWDSKALDEAKVVSELTRGVGTERGRAHARGVRRAAVPGRGGRRARDDRRAAGRGTRGAGGREGGGNGGGEPREGSAYWLVEPPARRRKNDDDDDDAEVVMLTAHPGAAATVGDAFLASSSSSSSSSSADPRGRRRRARRRLDRVRAVAVARRRVRRGGAGKAHVRDGRGVRRARRRGEGTHEFVVNEFERVHRETSRRNI